MEEAPGEDGPPEAEEWERYVEPKTERVWFWHEATQELFYADDRTSGWEGYFDSEGKPWWYHAASERYFFEDEEGET